MNKILKILYIASLILHLATSAIAVDHYVSSGGSATWAASTNPATPCSLSTANTNITPGNKAVMRADADYTASYIIPSDSGATGVGAGGIGGYLCDSYIEYEAYPGETPVIRSQTYGANLAGKSCIKITGIQFGRHTNAYKISSHWIQLSGSNRNHIKNCTFINAGGYEGIHADVAASNSYNIIEGSDFLDTSTDPATECGRTDCGSSTGCQTCPANYIEATYCTSCLFINNTFGRLSHTSIGIRANADYCVVYGNTFQNTWHHGISPYGTSTNTSDNLLISNNNFYRIAADYKNNTIKASAGAAAYDSNAIQIGGTGSIIRRNVFWTDTAYGTAFHFGTYVAGASDTYHRFYNNSDYGYYEGYSSRGQLGNVLNNEAKNNAFSGHTYGFKVYHTEGAGFSGNVMTYNRFYNTDYHRWLSHTGTLSEIQATSHGTNEVLSTNAIVNPQYRDTSISSKDLRLTIGSALIDAGTHITTTTTAGSGTSMPVADSYYFYSMETWQTPYHADMASDYIYIEGATPSEIVQITAVNRATHTLTLASPRTWSNGVGVGVSYSPTTKYCGTKPDIGAYEFCGQTFPFIEDFE